MVRVVSLSVLLALIVFLGLMFFQVVAPFLLPLFLAGVTAVLCQPLFSYFLRRTGQRVLISAGITTSILLLAILVPLSVGTIMAAAQLYVLSQDALTQTKWNRSIEWVKQELDFDSIYSRAEPYLIPIIVPDSSVRLPEVEILPPPDPVDNDYSSASNLDEDASATNRSSLPASKIRPPSFAIDDDSVVARPDYDPGDPPVEAWRPGDDIPDETPADTREAYENLGENIYVAAELDRRLENLKEQLRTNLQSAVLSLSQRTLNFAGATVNTTLDLLGALVVGLIGFIMFAIALFFFLADGPKMLTTMQELIPVHREYQRELWSKFENVIRAVVLATFLSAIAQGLLTAIALYAAGFRHFFIIWLLATAMSLIPLAGNWTVWGPCAVWLAYNGSWGTAIALALFGFLVISTIDNVIKTYVLQSDAKLHPLLAFVSVLGGLKAMGLAGIFVAPVVASCLHALVKIFNAELKAFSKQKFGVHDEPVTASSALMDAEFDSPESALVAESRHLPDPAPPPSPEPKSKQLPPDQHKSGKPQQNRRRKR